MDNVPAPDTFKSAVAYAIISAFSEQLAINSLKDEDDYFKKYAITDIKSALTSALGVGDDASFLFEPQEQGASNGDVKLTFVQSDEPSILSDTKRIYVTKGFVKHISDEAIATVFGSVAGFKKHLDDVATHDYSGFLTANKISIGSQEHLEVPLGYMLFGKDIVDRDPVIADVTAFAKEFVSKLLFATAHEIGHIRLHHNQTKFQSCTDFEDRELAADQFAAKYLANFVFRMDPDNIKKQRLVNFEAFFEDYGKYEFLGMSVVGNCLYPSPRKREKEVRKTVYRATVQLLQDTYSSADYTTPNPTSDICSNGTKSWNVYFGDNDYAPLEEMRRRSIEASKKGVAQQ
ncbi:hypothetical protein ELH72_08435 [Rhizobium ruizarguesonis]|uniref:ImmA/IrrE family metallo-endopeptidase n=1 Tax=Rhizobium ruizarguesonis TaxID=2081791 RepID=UPI0010DC7C5E|nr:hypothetical protein [Rhizobium ruizarguesonis]TAZ83286.1 hypothetical protein ELH72_08435 [Rhizobium ruizarguesonis]